MQSKQMHADPETTLPLTIENLEKRREVLGGSFENGPGGAAATPKHYYASDGVAAATAGIVPADFIMIGKFKTTVNEVLTCLGTPGNTYDLEDYIAVAEECLQVLKTLKVERRIESRRANILSRSGNASGGAAAYLPPASPSAAGTGNDGDEAVHHNHSSGNAYNINGTGNNNSNSSPTNGERSSTPAPTSYMAALLTKKRGSPKPPPPPPYRPPEATAVSMSREEMDAARQASALRSEERQRLAEERRQDRLQEIKLKSEAAEAREQRVKARREEAELRQRAEAEDRLENSRRRAEEARRQTAEKVQKAHVRGEDGGRVSSELRSQNRTPHSATDRKSGEGEQAYLSSEWRRDRRSDTAIPQIPPAVVTTAGNDQPPRTGKEAGASAAHSKAEHPQSAATPRQGRESVEATPRKNEEKGHRAQVSKPAEDSSRDKRRNKAEHVDPKKQKDSKNRGNGGATAGSETGGAEAGPEATKEGLTEDKDHNSKGKDVSETTGGSAPAPAPPRPTLHELMPPCSAQEEELLAQRVNKLVASSGRQGKAFMDTYQKESLSALKDLNRSKLRPAFSRLSSAVASVTVTTTSVAASSTATPPFSASQCRQPLNDLLGTTMTDSDHEFVRYFNQFDVLVRVISEARKVREASIVQQATDFLLLLFIDETEAKNNVTYFVRSGGAVALALCIKEEMKTARQHGSNDVLRWMLSVVGVCVERLSKESGHSKTVSLRDQFLNDLDVLGLDRMCLAIMSMHPNETDLELVYCAICVLNIELGVYSKRKNDLRPAWFQSVVGAFFSLLQSILIPDEAATEADAVVRQSYSCGRVTVLFCVFRTLNMLARWQLTNFQALLHEAKPFNSLSRMTATTTIANMSATGLGAQGSRTNIVGGAAATGAPPSTPTITRRDLARTLNTFFSYIQDHVEELETIPVLAPADGVGDAGSSNKAAAAGQEGNVGSSMTSLSTSNVAHGNATGPAMTFEDAVKYGLTLGEIPAFPPSVTSGKTPNLFQPGGRHYPLRAALHECLLLVGYLCLDDGPLQEMMNWGEKKSLLGNILNVLPAQYFSNAQHILFPTVLAAVNDNDKNMRVAMAEMEPSLLHAFITGEFNALSKGAKAYAQEHAKQMSQYKIETDPKHAVRHSISKSKNTNWADMVDDDSLLEARTSHSTETTSTTPAIEKDRLCKIFRAPGSTTPQSYPCFYKFDRRLPITYWPTIIEQLESVLQKKK